MSDYVALIDRKSQSGSPEGFDPTFIPDFLFDFQKGLVEWSVRMGRAALLCDCGLGKTPMQLAWAQNVVENAGSVLILTPLAVGAQTVREGEKFGIECHRSHDGKAKGPITIANYERLHLFDPMDYAGVVLDECFAKGTEIDTPNGRKHIEDVIIGDRIVNAAGVDTVADVHRREVPYAIRITINGRSITSSPNHPYFTRSGWKGAMDLIPGDEILATSSAVRMVRGYVHGEDRPGGKDSFLRSILLSEMANEPAGTLSEGAYAGSGSEARRKESRLVAVGRPEGKSGDGKDSVFESHFEPGDVREDIPRLESHEAQTFRAWGQRPWFDEASADTTGCVRTELDSGICFITGRADSRLSHGLQARLSQSRAENQYRGGWSLPLQQEGSGPEAGREGGFSRVDGLEVLEPGHPDLERSRDADGKLYFYDLGATRHPSFSVSGLLVHNSSVLKSFDGARRNEITEFMRKVRYRLLCTATAAPNDYIELGTSSEAIGNMGHIDMLNRFFVNDQNNSSQRRFYGEAPKWRFKGHAEIPFWRWVTSWARAVRKPSDLGFDDGPFVIPDLIERTHDVACDTAPEGLLFTVPAATLPEQRAEKRRTIVERCERVAALVANTGKPAVVWCQLNDEGDLLERIIPGAVQVSGSDRDAVKEERFESFSSGQTRVLITKAKIGAWGLNWQHCAHVLYFPSHSYEQYYQAVRRCWRFGQTSPVTVDIPLTEGERLIMANLSRKADQASQMFSNLVKEMNHPIAYEGRNDAVKEVITPAWLA